MKKPDFGTVLVIEVDRGKFAPTGVNNDKYRVETLNGEETVLVYRSNKFPVYLQFELKESRVRAIGFAKHGEKIEEYTAAGFCGGCFSLETDFPKEDIFRTPLIKNTGEDWPDGYDFRLFLHEGGFIDPRIYNNGNPQEGFWQKLFRFFLRLWWWLTSWFR